MALKLNVDLEQFKGLDANDIGSWPILVRSVAILALCALLLFLGYWFDTQHQWQTLEDVRKKEQELKDAYRVKAAKAASLEIYRKQMVEMERSFGAMARQLPSEAEVEGLLDDISQAVLANALESKLFKPGAESTAGFYAELPITISMSGSYHDFGRFVSDVAAMPRIVTLHDIKITGDDSDNLNMNAIAKTYRYLEKQK